MQVLGIVLGVVALAGGVAAYFWLVPGSRRDYRQALNEVYVRDPDDLGVPAAVAGYVDRLYRLHGDDLAATAVDLIARGVIEVRDDDLHLVDRSLLALRPKRAVGLWPHEVATLVLLLAPCGCLCPFASLYALHRSGWRNKDAYLERVADFAGCLVDEVDELGLSLEPRWFDPLTSAGALAAAMVLVAAIGSILAQTPVFLVVAVVLAIAGLLSDNLIYRRTRAGRTLQLRCRHLRQYWRDFGRLGEKDLDDVELWGRHLAFAVALGEARTARRELRWDDERLGRLAESLAIDDQSWYIGHDVNDERVADWLAALRLPETALVGVPAR